MLRSKKGLILQLDQLMKYYIWKTFMEKFAENVPQKLISAIY